MAYSAFNLILGPACKNAQKRHDSSSAQASSAAVVTEARKTSLMFQRRLTSGSTTLTKGGLRLPVTAHGWLDCTCEKVVVKVLPWRCGVVRIESEHQVIVKLQEVGRGKTGREWERGRKKEEGN